MKETKTQRCLFCEASHNSSTCEKAKSMPMNERMKVIRDKRGCFKCLKVGHSYKKCCNKEKCPWCHKGHCLLVCKNFSSNNEQSQAAEEPSEQMHNEGNSCLANISLNVKVFLPMLKVRMHGPKKSMNVRAITDTVIIDTVSHRSYILGKTAESLGYETLDEQTMVHLLFGGTETKPQNHKACRIYVDSLDGKYRCNFVAFQENIIYDDAPRVNNDP